MVIIKWKRRLLQRVKLLWSPKSSFSELLISLVEVRSILL